MKKLLKVLLLLAVATGLSAFPVLAETVTIDDVTYSYYSILGSDGKEIRIDGIKIAESVTDPIDLVIPASILDATDNAEYPVTAMSFIASSEADKIKSVSFAGDVPEIQGNLYEYQVSLVGATADTLGVETKTGSMGMLPGAMPEVPAYVTDNYNYDSNNDGTMDTYYAGENLVRLDSDYTGDFKVKDGTVSILAGAMEGCSRLGAVNIPDSVEWIGIRAFANSSVTSVNLPKGMLTEGQGIIQAWTFYGCDKLTEVTFPEGEEIVKRVTHMAFTGCSSLKELDFTRVESIDSSTFVKAFAEGTEIDLSNTQISGAYMAFSHSGIGKVTLGAKTSYLPFEVFRNCTSLTAVSGMNYIQSVGPWAFSGCTALEADILAESGVSSLDHRSFADTGMKEITIPETVSSISGGAFAGNEQLTTLNWKAEMSVGTPLFAYLNDMPAGNYSYQGTSFTMSKDNKDWAEYTFPTEINIYAPVSYSSGFFTMMQYLEKVNFCYGVSEIAYNQFAFCPRLKEVTFTEPEKLVNIQNGAFEGCLSLKEFPFEDLTELQSIGVAAFMLYGNTIDGNSLGLMTPQRYENLTDAQKAYGLTDIDLSKCTKLKSIGNGAFFNQYSAERIHLPESLSLGESASVYSSFAGTPSLKELTIDGTVNPGIITYYFYSAQEPGKYHNALETVTLNGDIVPMPEGVSGDLAMFLGMESLETVNITKSEYIPAKCFMNCTALKTVNMPNATNIGEFAFANCGLETVTLNAGGQYGPFAFYACENLKSVTFEKGAAEIGDYMFFECSDLTTVNAPDVTTIGDFAFAKTGLTEVAIAEGVTYGNGVFSDCASLEKVVVEEGVTELAPFLFERTKVLTEVALPSTLTKINWAAFKGSAGCMINVPDAVETIEDDAFAGVFRLILNGAPVIETEYDGDEAPIYDELNAAAIGAESVLYYTDDASKTAAELYIVNANPESDPLVSVPTVEELPPVSLEVVVTGAPETAEAGKALDLSQLKVTYDNAELTAQQYELDYNPDDKTLGERTVIVKITDTDIVQERHESSEISVIDFAGETVTGEVYSFADPTKVSTTFAVNVVDHYHDPEAVPEKEATCTETGNNAYYVCVVCGVPFKDEACTIETSVEAETVPLKDHQASDWKYDSKEHWKVCMAESCGAEIKDSRAEHNYDSTNICDICKYERVVVNTECPKDATCPLAVFKDVIKDAWYHDGIHYAVENKLMLGLTANTFGPDQTTSRAMIVTILWRMNGSPVVKGKTTFKDVVADSWYEDAVKWAASTGVVTGYSDVKFAPDDDITREQMATILYRYSEYVGYDVSVSGSVDMSAYKDAKQVSDWAEKAMIWVLDKGFIKGLDANTLAPTGNADRAQAATILSRFCESGLANG